MSGKKKIKEAAALRYTVEEDEAPVVLAIGRGEVAEKILDKAQTHDIPVVEDASLAHALAQMNIGDQIPEALYVVVAQILLFVGDMDEQFKGR
jgi:flagellar biosynthesis protein